MWANSAEACDDRLVITKISIAVKLAKIFDKSVYIVSGLRTIRVSSYADGISMGLDFRIFFSVNQCGFVLAFRSSTPISKPSRRDWASSSVIWLASCVKGRSKSKS